ncbi:MAG: ATP-binding protein, partial [Limnochordales bacterium]
ALYDEAWALLASPHGQRLLLEGIRDGRKHNGAIWLASQHPNDLGTGELVDLVGSRFVFRQSPGAIEAATRFLGAEDSAEAAHVLSQGLATAAIDLSDGLAGDLRRLCAASGVGAIIDEAALPISDDVRRVAQAAGLDPLALALGGGEDYELLFTMSRYRTGTHVLPGSGTTYTVIGEIVDASQGVMLRRRDGELQPLPAGGFQHF